MAIAIRTLFNSLLISGFGLFLLTGCGHSSGTALIKAGRAELLELHRSGKFSLEQAVILKQNGKKVDGHDVQKLKQGALAGDYYLDQNRIIRKVVVRPANHQDRITAILLNNMGYDPRNGIEILDLNCDSLRYAMEEFYRAQPSAFSEQIPDTMGLFDFERMKIVSLVENCGFPSAETLGEKGMRTFWLMVQHNEPELMAYYYPAFEQEVETGGLKESTFVLMTDRLLVNNNYPQVYGSQIVNWSLYPIENPDSVDIRRASVGLEPLEEYLKNFDLN
ncbi:MAG: hypothetical protein J5I98_34430 [Phaeodactylibacter sp.]|nr:hypothetical protein [Phaeodactylibacter sp.]